MGLEQTADRDGGVLIAMAVAPFRSRDDLDAGGAREAGLPLAAPMPVSRAGCRADWTGWSSLTGAPIRYVRVARAPRRWTRGPTDA
jgi:hypothetical protein